MFKTAALVGKHVNEIEKLLEEAGFRIAKNEGKNPDFVISYGGDGTLLQAEHAYPGIPKLALKKSRICKLCTPQAPAKALQKIKQEKCKIKNSLALEIHSQNRHARGMNDVVVHNADPRRAIRYRIWRDEKEIDDDIIGDGIVAATPIGSAGYYRSITGSIFEAGIGLAFNNSTEEFDHMVIKETSKLRMQITRGPAIAFADNQEEIIELKEKDEIVIKRSPLDIRIISFPQKKS